MKILLIEDRTQRQQLFTDETGIDLDKYSDILDNCVDNRYSAIYEKLKNDNFDFSEYSIIISHKSAFDKDNYIIIERLKKYCSEQRKTLIFFSGGIDENYYKKSFYELILTNSKTFYSINLKLFLEAYKTDNSDVLMLLYGKRWKLNIALNILEDLNKFLQKNEDDMIDYGELEGEVDIELFKKIEFNYKPNINDFDEISRLELLELKASLKNYINESIKYE